MRTEVN